MTITLSKPIAIIILVCLALIIICDIAIWILKMYQKRLDKIESKYEISIGKYDKELNKTNSTFLVGKGLKGQYTEIVVRNENDDILI